MATFPRILFEEFLGAVGKPLAQANTQQAARATIGALSTDETRLIVVDAIADDGTVADAAAEAVSDAVVGLSLLESDDPRIPQPIGESDYALVETDDANRVSRYVTNSGLTWVTLHPDVTVHGVNLAEDIPVPVVAPTDGRVVFAITDDEDQAAFAINEDSTVDIPHPSQRTLEAFGQEARTIPEPSWSTRRSRWNPEKALYNYHPTSLQHWHAGLARATAGTGSAHLVATIDSETYGRNGSQPMWANSWPGRVRRLLDNLTGYGSGTGIAVPWNQIHGTGSVPADDPRWTFGAGAAQLAGAGATGSPFFGVQGRGAVQLTNNTGTGFLEFAPVGPITRFTIYATADAGASGVATVKVDGVSVGTFDVSTVGGAGTLARRTGMPANVIVIDTPSGTSGTHTVRVEGPAASTVTIWGVEGRTDKGVRVSNFGRSGVGIAQLILDDASNHRYGMPLHFDAAKADLVLMMLGLNDRDEASSMFVPAVSTAIERVQAAGGDVLLICPGQPNYAVTPDSLQPRLHDLYGLADEYDVPLLDLAWVRTDFATANALGLYDDEIHSNDTGLEHHARFIFNALTGV